MRVKSIFKNRVELVLIEQSIFTIEIIIDDIQKHKEDSISLIELELTIKELKKVQGKNEG